MRIPAVLSNIDLLSLQKKLSIKVPFVLVNLVGKVICGKRLCGIKESKQLLYIYIIFI